MQFNIDGKTYDSDDLADGGKAALAQLVELSNERNRIMGQLQNIDILDAHHSAVLRSHLPAPVAPAADAPVAAEEVAE